MDAKLWIELFGYLGSGLVVVSMLMTSVYRLRIINTIGSVIFMIYALIIRSYPTAAMNFFLICINVYHLMQLRNKERHFDLIESGTEDQLLDYQLTYFHEDIAKYFPDFFSVWTDSGLKAADGYKTFSVCCDHEVAGALVGKQEGSDLKLLLDYTTPAYRDCSVGEFVYPELKKKGYARLIYEGNNPAHISYVEKMGFARSDQGSYVWESK